ncbi:MAG: hypothetical protein IPK81_11795 [Rhodospirillales bacterium]|nr:MAG: hypothetical protein IPK81_11795 [Rhodospirillales bacterium]
MPNAVLPVFDVVGSAYRRVFGHGRDLMAIGRVPFFLLTAVGVVDALVGNESFSKALNFAVNIMMIMVLLAWHRVFLFGLGDADAARPLNWTSRAWKFLWNSFGIAFLAVLLVIALAMIGLAIGGTQGLVAFGAAGLMIVAPAVASLGLVFPAIAADHPAGWKTIWAYGEGNRWRLVATGVLTALPTFVVSLLIIAVVAGLLYAGGSPRVVGVVAAPVFAIIQLVGGAVLAASLSYSYRVLSRHPDPLDGALLGPPTSV